MIQFATIWYRPCLLAGLSVEVQKGLGSRTFGGVTAAGLVDNVVATLPGYASTGAGRAGCPLRHHLRHSGGRRRQTRGQRPTCRMRTATPNRLSHCRMEQSRIGWAPPRFCQSIRLGLISWSPEATVTPQPCGCGLHRREGPMSSTFLPTVKSRARRSAPMTATRHSHTELPRGRRSAFLAVRADFPQSPGYWVRPNAASTRYRSSSHVRQRLHRRLRRAARFPPETRRARSIASTQLRHRRSRQYLQSLTAQIG